MENQADSDKTRANNENVMVKIETIEEAMNSGANDEFAECLTSRLISQKDAVGYSATGSSILQVATTFVCQQCEMELGTLEEFIEHMRTAHLQRNPANEERNATSYSSADAQWPASSADAVDAMGTAAECPLCGLRFQNTLLLGVKDQHFLEHFLHSQTSWSCQKCDANDQRQPSKFSTLVELHQHFLLVHMHTIFRCAICLELFSERDTLLEHMLVHHTGRLQAFKCVACDQQFQSRLLFQTHIQQSHLGIQQQEKGKRAAETGRIGPSKNGNGGVKKNGSNKLARRESSNNVSGGGTEKHQYSNGMTATTTPVRQPTFFWGAEKRGLMCCIVCDAEFPDELSLDRHRLLEHCKQPKGSKCAICHANLANLGVFMEHSRAHGAGGSSELSCVICRQTIRGDQQLQMHGKYHLLEWEERGEEFMAEHNESAETLAGSTAVVECSTCKQTVNEADYAKHVLVHVVNVFSTPSPTIATAEEKSAESNAISVATEEHCDQQSPSNNSSADCSECGKTFESVDLLNLHMLAHLGELISGNAGTGMKEANADWPSLGAGDRQRREGSKRWTEVDNVRNPMKTNSPKIANHESGRVQCNNCGQMFASMSRLLIHRRRHQQKDNKNGKGMKCRICDRKFSSPDLLAEHSRAQHSVIKVHGPNEEIKIE